ncbi:organomercurial lyase [Streptomyces sp. NPDC019890]|uniref:organomercurial lyase n=1 Tax=Streptomyces sp. NPDC019890 TaxID=3365064 RepID=UPI00384DB5E4
MPPCHGPRVRRASRIASPGRPQVISYQRQIECGRSRHCVRIIDGPEVRSMCASDALGVGAMTDERVTITVHDGQSAWELAEAVVFVGRRACSTPAAAVCCDALNFFTGRASATAWEPVIRRSPVALPIRRGPSTRSGGEDAGAQG